MKYSPHAYQRRGIQLFVSQGAAGLFLDPGMGKTSMTYAAFKVLRSKGYVEKMLVVAPLRPAYSVWPGEATKWDEFRDLKVVVLHGPHKAKRLAEPADVYVINPEGLGWLLSQKLDWFWDMLVVDESTRFKHANTQRFRILRPHLSRFKRRYILTGSPAPNGLLDLFGQIFVLDLGRSLGQYITHYRANYFLPTGYGGYTWVPKKGAPEAIYERLSPLVLRMAGSDYLDLPPLINNVVDVRLDDAARAAYERMEATLTLALKNRVVTAANAAVATGKCRQIANGGIFHDGGEEWTNIHEEKVEAVKEIVEELSGKPALIAYEYRHDLDRLRRAFPDAPWIGGGVPPKRFRELEAAWNRGDLSVLFAQPQSVAHGLNLQGTAAAVIWHSLPWDLEAYEQFVRRVWRQGQQDRVVVHHVVAKDTIDEVVMRTLRSKDRTQQALLEALKERLS